MTSSPGRLIAVVGPSGVGKDSVMAGLAASDPGLQRVRRVITRDADQGGEDHTPMTAEAFEAAAGRGAFCLHWSAHGLRYGLPAQVLRDVNAGADLLANCSRGALTEAASVFPRMVVLHITADPKVLAQRLADRGRENAADIERRLARATDAIPGGLIIITVRNDGALEDTVAAAHTALQPVRA